jgi:hypothetical protein
MIRDQELLDKIFNNHKMLISYYPYKTGGHGDDNVVAKTDNWSGNQYDYAIKNFVLNIIQLGAALAGRKSGDNKTAVELRVDGIDFPIYCYYYDGLCSITKEIKSEHEPIEIHWVLW